MWPQATSPRATENSEEPNSFYGTVPVVVQTASGSATNANGFAYGIEKGNGIEQVSAIGGLVNAVAVDGNSAFVGEGNSFVVVDVSNSASPTPIGRVSLPGKVEDIALSGRYAYVAARDAGLQVVDVGNLNAPKIVGFYDIQGWADGVALLGTKVYVADQDRGLLIFDASNPTAPTLVSTTAVSGAAFDVAVATNGNAAFAYVTVDGRLLVVDVSNPSVPAVRGQVTLGSYALAVAVSGSRAFVAAFGNGLRMVDISNPGAPVDLGQAPLSGVASSVAVANGLVYLGGSGSLRIFSYTQNSMTRIGLYSGIAADGYNLVVTGNRAYVASGTDGFQIINVADPTNPARTGALSALAGNYSTVAVAGGRIYSTAASGVLKVFSVTNPALPTLLGQFVNPSGGGGSGWIATTNDFVFFFPGGDSKILNVSNPSLPVSVGTIPSTVADAYKGVLSGNVLVVAGFNSKVVLFDVTSPASPVQRGQITLSQGFDPAVSLAVRGTKAVVGMNAGSVRVLDISNPNSPIERGQMTGLGFPRDVALSSDGNYAYAIDGNVPSVLRVINVSNPGSPLFVTNIVLDSSAGQAVTIDGDFLCAVTFRNVFAFDVTNPRSPILQRSYSVPGGNGVAVSSNALNRNRLIFLADTGGGLLVLATKDTEAPSISIDTPTTLRTYTNTSGTVNLAGRASDNSSLNAMASSGQPVLFTVLSGPATISGNNLVTITDVGTVMVRASQSGNTNFNAAQNVDRSFVVAKRPQFITFGALNKQVFGDAPFSLSASASSGMQVDFEVLAGPAIVSGNVLTMTGSGLVVLRASQSGDATYAPAPSVDQVFSIAPGNNLITDFQRLPNGNFAFRFYGDTGVNCVVEGSTDLVNWVPLATNQISAIGYFDFTDTTATGFSRRFYRTLR